MENKDSEKWVEDVLGSMQGRKVVPPSRDLFMDIQNQIEAPKVRVVLFSQRMMAMAAAVLLLTVNIFAMNSYGFFENDTEAIVSGEVSKTPELVSDFKIYE